MKVDDSICRTRYEKVLDEFIQEVQEDTTISAAILFGSLVNGVVWEKSDIDLVLITKDTKTPYRDFWLFEEDINIQVSVFTRNQFIKNQRDLQGAARSHVIATSKVLFSEDETLNEFIASMKEIGKRDLELRG